jgi:indolepyruvate ferredoxin oxidoreductase alpha subunit
LFGRSRIPIYVLNVAYPLAPEELRGFCAGKRAVLVVEEGYPEYIEQAVTVELRRADLNTRVFGKGPLPQTGEYTSDVGAMARPVGLGLEPPGHVAGADAQLQHYRGVARFRQLEAFLDAAHDGAQVRLRIEQPHG